MKSLAGLSLILFDIMKNNGLYMFLLSIIVSSLIIVYFYTSWFIPLIILGTFFLIKEDIEKYLLFVTLGIVFSLTLALIYISLTSDYKNYTKEKIIKNVEYASINGNYYVVDRNNSFKISEKEFVILKTNKCKNVLEEKQLKVSTNYKYLKTKNISTTYKCYK